MYRLKCCKNEASKEALKEVLKGQQLFSLKRGMGKKVVTCPCPQCDKNMKLDDLRRLFSPTELLSRCSSLCAVCLVPLTRSFSKLPKAECGVHHVCLGCTGSSKCLICKRILAGSKSKHKSRDQDQEENKDGSSPEEEKKENGKKRGSAESSKIKCAVCGKDGEADLGCLLECWHFVCEGCRPREKKGKRVLKMVMCDVCKTQQQILKVLLLVTPRYSSANAGRSASWISRWGPRRSRGWSGARRR